MPRLPAAVEGLPGPGGKWPPRRFDWPHAHVQPIPPGDPCVIRVVEKKLVTHPASVVVNFSSLQLTPATVNDLQLFAYADGASLWLVDCAGGVSLRGRRHELCRVAAAAGCDVRTVEPILVHRGIEVLAAHVHLVSQGWSGAWLRPGRQDLRFGRDDSWYVLPPLRELSVSCIDVLSPRGGIALLCGPEEDPFEVPVHGTTDVSVLLPLVGKKVKIRTWGCRSDGSFAHPMYVHNPRGRP